MLPTLVNIKSFSEVQSLFTVFFLPNRQFSYIITTVKYQYNVESVSCFVLVLGHRLIFL